ncbi:MAG: DNA-3-methyladenine glycosylase [Acidobacteriia bacterium]|nr:DNA-3-methyladenine glycosylase [Terriglobia bacterium]
MRGRTLSQKFYDRDPRIVAQELLGKVLVRRERGREIAGRIVEVEVYLGQDDPAAHAFSGPTARNRVLFGPPGHAYVYFIYGNHFCLNVSCMPEGEAGCVLIRALEPLTGLAQMAARREVPASQLGSERARKILTSGPGRLAEAFGITRARDNGKDVATAQSDLRIVNDGYRPEKVASTARIGITKAKDHALRYVIAGNPFVSGSATLNRRAGER